MDKACFVLSLDTELAWGCSNNQRYLKHNLAYFDQSRKHTSALLELLGKYRISATWAVVGHLLLSQCRPQAGQKHPEIIRPGFAWLKHDWFELDPCTSLKDDPIWYGKDIVDAIRQCKTEQEIACHSFSHIIADDPGCSQACFESELKACLDIAGLQGIQLSSFVFPRNRVNFTRSLQQHNFIVYRGKDHHWYNFLPPKLQNYAYGLDSYLFFLAAPVVVPVKTDCWNIRGSYFYGHSDGLARFLPVSFRVLKINKGIDKAVQSKSIFHLWFHPFNLSSNPDVLLNGLETIFQHVHSLVNQGSLENLTMGALARKLG